MLIRPERSWASAAGAAGCVLVGDPAWYARFGFRHLAGLSVAGVPDAYVLALPFGAERPQGAVGHHEAFATAGRQTKSASCH